MTTLPQTSPARPPQAATSAMPAPYTATPLAVPAGAHMTGADIWRVIRANIWLILAFLVLSAAAGYGVNWVWAKYWPSYSAVGLLKVEAQLLEDPVAGKISDMTDTRLVGQLRTHSKLLMSDTLFNIVLQKDKVRQTDWFRSMKDADEALEYLRDNFVAVPYADSELIEVRFDGSSPEDCRTMVNELVDAHLKDQRDRVAEQYAAQLKTLRGMADQLARNRDFYSKRSADTQKSLMQKGMNSPGLYSVKDIELRAVIEQQLKVFKDASDARFMFERTKQTIAKGGDLPAEVQKAVENDPTLSYFTRELVSLQIQRQAKTEAKGGTIPDIQYLESLIKETQKQIDDRKADLTARYKAQYVEVLEMLAMQAEENYKKMTDQANTLKTEMAQTSDDLVQFMGDKEEEKALRELHQAAEGKWRDIQVTFDRDARARIQWAMHPEKPDLPSLPRLKYTMPISILLGLCLALGIAFLRELTSDTVRSPRDVSRVGQLNLLGIIADESDDPMVEDARLAIFDAPHSATAEQFRQVRTRLAHAAPLDTTRSIMITGPSALDGKTTVAANLAAGLALNGRRILLVDANFRRPELHRLFGLSNERGFSDVLNGTAQLADVASASRVPNLSVLTSGAKPTNAAELFESQLLVDFIDHALEQYDHIIFDTAPFLVVAESQAMASRVDGVVTVVRAHAESRGMLQRMRDALRQIKAEHLGVVLNAVRAQGGGYYRRSIKAFYNYNNEA